MENSTSSNYLKERLLSKDYRESFEDAHFFIDIAVQLHRLRAEAGLTQRELAELTGLKQANVARYESPGYQSYTFKILLKMIRALGGKLRLEIRKRPSARQTYSFSSRDRHQFVDARSDPAGASFLRDSNKDNYISATKSEANYV